MGAGPVPEIWHRLLNACAWLVRLRVLPSLSPFAGLMYRTVNTLAWGEHRGGMFVAVAGAGPDGQRIERFWHLLAEGEDGPLIPSMAAAAIVRHCLRERHTCGGRACRNRRPRSRRLRGAVCAAPDHHRPPAIAGRR